MQIEKVVVEIVEGYFSCLRICFLFFFIFCGQVFVVFDKNVQFVGFVVVVDVEKDFIGDFYVVIVFCFIVNIYYVVKVSLGKKRWQIWFSVILKFQLQNLFLLINSYCCFM